jgi:hypothetical protein
LVTSPTILDLHAALDADPGDHGLRAVLADAVEEAGDPIGADALRWMAHWKRWPDRNGNRTTIGSVTWTASGWRWYSYLNDANCDTRICDHHSFLSTFGRVSFPMLWDDSDMDCWQSSTRKMAEESVMAAWSVISPADRAYWWKHGPHGEAPK